jgi:hypothetical protein
VTALLGRPVLTANAFKTLVGVTESGVLYTNEAVVGVVPVDPDVKV